MDDVNGVDTRPLRSVPTFSQHKWRANERPASSDDRRPPHKIRRRNAQALERDNIPSFANAIASFFFLFSF